MEWMTLSPEEWTAVRLSLKVAVVATLVSLPFGIAIAMALALKPKLDATKDKKVLERIAAVVAEVK